VSLPPGTRIVLGWLADDPALAEDIKDGLDQEPDEWSPQTPAVSNATCLSSQPDLAAGTRTQERTPPLHDNPHVGPTLPLTHRNEN
jgi:hypothetical protein